MAAAAHPVRTLRDLVTLFEAAATLAVANPRPRSVHRLRTTTRCIEAQLELLALLPDLPKHAKSAKKARKLLGRLRRAAGRLRDLDVQLDLTPPKSGEGNRLRSLFKQQRERAAKRLIDTIHKHQGKLNRTLEALLEALATAEALTIPASQIAQLILHWYTCNAPAAAKQNHRQLHTIRKAAKLARYIAESAMPASKPGTSKRTSAIDEMARSFESLQQSGGEWHDWLTLSGIAHRELGTTSPLARSFANRCERSLASYQRHLKSLSKEIIGDPVA